MELFKLFGTIAIDGEAEATRILNSIASKASNLARQVADKLDLEVKVDASKAEDAFEDLSTTIAAQERVLKALKRDYSSVVLEQGKNSKSAKALKKEIKNVSSELQTNKTKLQNAESAADKFDRTLRDLGTTAKNTANGGFTVLKGAMANLVSQGFSRVLQAGGQLISNAFNYQSALEGYNTSFTVMTGSAEKAAEITEELAVIAKETPFEMTTLADTTQLLINYGLTADEAITRMRMLGDISQGNSEKMNRVALAYGQMSSAGKVQLQDIKQMIEAGFNPLKEISESTGESMDSLYKRISKGTISVDEITESMIRSTSEGGKYFGSMDMQAQTMQGRLSTLKDTINEGLGKALSGAMERLANEILPKVTAALEEVDWEALGEKIAKIADAIIDFGLWIIDNFDTVITLVKAFIAAWAIMKVISLIKSVTSAIYLMTGAQWALNTAMYANPIGIIIVAIIALIAIFAVLWKKCEGFRNFWKGLWSGIKDVVSGVVDGIKSVWSGIISFFKNIANKLKNIFNFKWNLPKIKLPKFSIKPAGWEFGDLLKGKIPKLAVTWHADAMDKGLILDEPTIFGMDSAGRLHGAGEVGSETVVGTDSLMNMIRGAVKQETGATATQLQRISDMLSMFFPKMLATAGEGHNVVLDDGALIGRIAPKLNVKLNDLQNRESRGG